MKHLFLILLFPALINAQINTAEYYLDPGQSIHYFDDEWKKSTKSEGDFYRIVTLDSNNMPISKIKDYYKSGKIQTIIDGAISIDNNDDSNSKFDGNSKVYYESGQVSVERFYKNGKTDGVSTGYYESGKVYYTYNSINGNIEGVYKTLYESGKIKEIENFVKGVKTDYTSFHENGNTKITYKLINGNIEGLWKSFNENGSREQEVNFTNGVRVGLLRDFYENNKLNFIQKYNEKGQKYYEESFSEDGQITNVWNYKNEEIHGENLSYYSSGSLKSKIIFANGIRNGITFEYFEDGKIMSDEIWENGEIIDWKQFDKYGNLIFDEKAKKIYSLNLNKDFRVVMEDDDELEDKVILYKRYMIFSGERGFDQPHKRIIMYMENEEASSIYSEVFVGTDSNWEGKAKWYYKNGKLEQSAEFENGKRNGETNYYDEDGSYERSVSYINGVKDLWNYKCDNNNQNCEYNYTSYFSSTEEAKNKGWNFYDDDDEHSFIPTSPEKAKNKYYLQKKNDSGLFRRINLSTESDDGFQFKTTVDWWNGVQNSYFGIIVGWKDWENYTRLMIAPNGWHKAEIWSKGVNIGMADGKKVENGGYGQPTTLNIVKINGGTIFSVDGKPIYSSEYSSFLGDKHGFYMSGKQSVVFDNVKATRTPSNRSSRSNEDNKRNEGSSDWAGNGSGVILTSNGYIATNNHVIEDARDIEVEFLYKNEIRSFNATVIQTDRINDLAILKIQDSNFSNLGVIPYSFKTKNVEVGESVFALGYPMALSGMGKEIKFTDGRISSRTGFQGDITTFQSTTPIQGGNSGGPLFDLKGNLIAINSAKLKADVADNVSYSIKSSYLLSLIDALPQNISVPNSSLLTTKPLTEQIKTLSKFVVLIKVK